MAFAITATRAVELDRDAVLEAVVEEDLDPEEDVKGAWKVRRHDTRRGS